MKLPCLGLLCPSIHKSSKKPPETTPKSPEMSTHIHPSPTHDAETLKKAFRGLGTDENTIIRVLGKRNASQRRQIKDAYKELYKEELIDALNSELSGDFGRAIILWTYDPPERDATLANEALKSEKKGVFQYLISKRNDVKQFQVIVEIACASSPHHLMAVRQSYRSLFDLSLEEDIASSVPASLRKLLVGLVSSYRYDKELIDMVVAESEAAKLHEAIKMKQLDNDGLVWILSTRNFFQLRVTFDCYRRKFSNPFEQDIESCGNGDLGALLKIAVLCIDCPEKHFAEVIRTSILGLGTDEDSLTRAIVTRAEVDMAKIKDEYFKAYKDSVEDAVIGDTSGYYKNFLLALLGSEV